MAGIFEGAKKAKEKAVEKTGELGRQAIEKTDDLRAKSADASSVLKEQIAGHAGEMMESSYSRLSTVIDELNNALPVLSAAGYQMSGVSIKLGVPPSVAAEFDIIADDVSEEKVNALLEQHAERKMTALLVRSLMQARKLQSKVKLVGMQPQKVSVDIGLIPLVGVKFGRTKQTLAESPKLLESSDGIS